MTRRPALLLAAAPAFLVARAVGGAVPRQRRNRRRRHRRRSMKRRPPKACRPRCSPAAASGASRRCSSTPRASPTRCPAMPAATRGCELRARRQRPHRPRRGGAGHLRPEGHLLRQAAADLLLGRARSDQLNRQGPDSGPQYRSEIFPQNDEQAKVAKAYVAQLDAAKVFPQADRDQDRHHEGRVLSGRGLSPGLRDAASEQALHRVQRRAEGGEPEAHVPGRCSATSRCWWRRRRRASETPQAFNGER